MTDKLLALHIRAELDVEVALSYYRSLMSPLVSDKFVAALEKSFNFLIRFPKAGSVRLGEQIGRSDIRSWPLNKYPYLVVYKELPDQVDVFRVLHQRRDLVKWMPD